MRYRRERHEVDQLPLPPHLRAAAIDRQMVPIISALWRKGWTTHYCCEGGPDSEAYIRFGSVLEAALFVGLVSPVTSRYREWRDEYRQARSRLTYDDAWLQQWLLEGDTVRFPSSALPRIIARLPQLPRLPVRIGAPPEATEARPPAPAACPTCGLGAPLPSPEAHRSAPITCAACGIPILSRRRDARYCSRRCQLRGRDRRARGVSD